MRATMSELKPCPFCGCSATVLAKQIYSEKILFVVACDVCGGKTRGFHGSKEAIEAWNRRVDNG